MRPSSDGRGAGRDDAVADPDRAGRCGQSGRRAVAGLGGARLRRPDDGGAACGHRGGGLLVVLAALQDWAALDVALVLALLAALAVVGFAKARTPDGAGDPEEDAAHLPGGDRDG
jgi:hypothetical protein